MLLNPQNKEVNILFICKENTILLFQVIVDFYHNRLPLLFKACHKQNIRCLAPQSNQTQLIGSIRKRYVSHFLSLILISPILLIDNCIINRTINMCNTEAHYSYKEKH